MSVSKKQPALVAVCLPTLLLGGSELATLQMVTALLNAGWRIRVICYYEFAESMVERYRNCGAEVLLLKRSRSGGGEFFRLVRALFRLFRRDLPQVVHGVYYSPGLAPLLAARLAGIRTVLATVHAAGGRGYGVKAKIFLRFSSLLTTHFFCVSRNAETFWYGRTGGLENHHSTIYNGVELGCFADALPVERPDLPSGLPVIGSVGRLVRLKGLDCLLRAVARLTVDYPELKLLLVGAGPEEQKLKSLAADLQIADRLVWAGAVAPEQLGPYFRRMDIFVSASHWEGFGLTTAEAMAAGVPVVVTDVPGLREVVSSDGAAGFLFEVNDDIQLSGYLERLLQAPALRRRLGEAGQARVKKNFSLRTQQEAWVSAYRKLTGYPDEAE